ncbi:MAG: tight adherence protein B, partial [Nitriliruptoraceae bacterium]
LEHAREAWPRMLEELRLQVVSLGRSVPQALFTVGARGPLELRPAFDAARREWVMSTDFGRTLDVLRAKLSDATADAVCETLLIAHEVGGTDVDRRLRALIDDRIADLEGRKDARSEQAAARFARSFVLVVPLGMATVGLTIGNGRDAYRDPLGQIGVLIALSLIAVCWLWASRMLKLPTEDRVFRGSTKEAA